MRTILFKPFAQKVQHRSVVHPAPMGPWIDKRVTRGSRGTLLSFGLLLCLLIKTDWSYGATLTVGPDSEYPTPSRASAHARDGDEVVIEPGVYRGDVAVWHQNDLTIRGLGGGAHIAWQNNTAEEKALWVIKGNNVTVENIEFSGARVADRNGAGIRHEGANITIRRCRFHGNENGILSGRTGGTTKVESSIFYDNGHGDGRSHSLYIGHVDRLLVTGSSFYHARVGHHIKSRADATEVSYNKVLDKEAGTSSYLVDLPEGGEAVLLGNVLQQGRLAENSSLVSYAAEMPGIKSGNLIVINNTFINERDGGVFINVFTPNAEVLVQNNVFFGNGQVSNREISAVANLVVDANDERATGRGVFVDRRNFDYRLVLGSPAIDAGVDAAMSGLAKYVPLYEHTHPADLAPRYQDERIDQGAYEFAGGLP